MKTRTFAACTLGIALAVLTVSSPALADRVDRRQIRQGSRIAAGACNGALTQPEAARLMARERALARDERFMGRNGLSLAERRGLERRQDRLSRDIYRQKHDRQNRIF